MTTVDKYISELKKKLVDPEPYEFEGIYHYLGKEKTHFGKILIDKNMNIAGEIRDPNSMCPKHAVKGKISIENKLVRMDFDKISIGLLVPIHYSLGKLNNNGIVGEYDGMWTFQEEGILLKIGYKPGIGEAVMIAHPENSNRTSLRLYK
ncbi:MAG: hypothetical protein V1645_03805 [archaeon]